MTNKNKTKFISVIVWLLLLLLLIGGVAMVLHFAGIGKDDIIDIVKPTFRVEYGENVYKSETENILDLPESGQVRFEIKNCESCTIKVLPNVTAETDFTFTVNGQEKKYSEVEDLTAAFIQPNNVYGDYFIIDSDNDYSLESVLSKLYGAESVEINAETAIYPYKMVVTSSSGEKIGIEFRQSITSPQGIKITLDRSAIIF